MHNTAFYLTVLFYPCHYHFLKSAFPMDLFHN